MDLLLKAVIKCMAMMNSVASRAPFCSRSARPHIRPSTSLGSPAFSKMFLAISPGNCPFCAPDLSNRPEYCWILSVVSGGIRIEPVPCDWRTLGWVDATAGELGARVMPSNLGNGAASRLSVSTMCISVLCEGVHLKPSSAVGSLPA